MSTFSDHKSRCGELSKFSRFFVIDASPEGPKLMGKRFCGHLGSLKARPMFLNDLITSWLSVVPMWLHEVFTSVFQTIMWSLFPEDNSRGFSGRYKGAECICGQTLRGGVGGKSRCSQSWNNSASLWKSDFAKKYYSSAVLLLQLQCRDSLQHSTWSVEYPAPLSSTKTQ